MTKNFLAAFREVIDAEGGYQCDPDDPGNWTGGKKGVGELKGTKFGLSAATYPGRDIKNLTLQDAQAIYYIDFWRVLRLDDVTDYQIALEIFDTSVNCGQTTAAITAQKALKFLGEQIVVDGKVGNATIERLNKWSKNYPLALHKALNGYQFILYERIVMRALENPQDCREKYAAGWLKRIQYYNKRKG